MSRQDAQPRFIARGDLHSTALVHQPLSGQHHGLTFTVCGSRSSASTTPAALPFAWLGGGVRLGSGHLPFARVASGVWEPPASADSLMKQLMSEEPDEPQGPKRGHTDEWYQQRCIFCAKCKSTINSHYQKRGSRCQGCRRWFHAGCMPAAVASPGSASAEGQESGSGDGNNNTANSSIIVRPRRRRTLFFHDEDCQQVYDRLAAVAAAGHQPFSLPDPRPFWQQLFSAQQPDDSRTWRLLDLTEVRQLYKDAQKRETLFRQHNKAQRQLAAAADAAAEREAAAKRNRGFFGFGGGSKGSTASSSSDAAAATGGGAGGDAASSSSRRVSPKASSLDEFLVVSEVLKPLGETPRDLLEDSYAIITREGSDGPAAVATFNVYGSDHARLQGVATPVYLRKQGHATRLVQQLELVLGDVGVQALAVILEPQDDKRKPDSQLLSSEAAQQWFKKRLGFRPASSEQQMLWRRELPEYHKGLIGGCPLLLKPISKGKNRVAAAAAKGRGSKKA